MGKRFHPELCPVPTKGAYPNERSARRGASDMARIRVAAGEHFDPAYGYVCPCGSWHITTHATWNGQPNVLLRAVPDELQTWAQTPAEGSAAFAVMDDDDVERFVL